MALCSEGRASCRCQHVTQSVESDTGRWHKATYSTPEARQKSSQEAGLRCWVTCGVTSCLCHTGRVLPTCGWDAEPPSPHEKEAIVCGSCFSQAKTLLGSSHCQATRGLPVKEVGFFYFVHLCIQHIFIGCLLQVRLETLT